MAWACGEPLATLTAKMPPVDSSQPVVVLDPWPFRGPSVAQKIHLSRVPDPQGMINRAGCSWISCQKLGLSFQGVGSSLTLSKLFWPLRTLEKKNKTL